MTSLSRLKVKTRSLTLAVAIPLLALSSTAGALDNTSKPAPSCSPTTEFITSMEFLRSKSEWALKEPEMRQISLRVSQNCPGSAARFIRIGRLLTETGFAPREALETAIAYAAQSNDVTERFTALFKKLYLEDQLDLDMRTSATLAHQLSAKLEGSLPQVEKEFAELTAFCAEDSGLNQGKPVCAQMAARVIESARSQSKGVAKRWKKAFEFLRTHPGTQLATGEAATLASEIVATGEVGTESFIQAFKYASSQQGLKLERTKAIDFSRELVLGALPTTSSTEGRRPARSRD